MKHADEIESKFGTGSRFTVTLPLVMQKAKREHGASSLLFLRELYEVAASVVKDGDSYRSHFGWRSLEHDTQVFQSFVRFLNILNGK